MARSRRNELVGQFVNKSLGRAAPRRGGGVQRRGQTRTGPPAAAPSAPALTTAQQGTVSNLENAYNALPNVERKQVSGARRTRKYKWAGEKVARHTRPQGAQYRSNAPGGAAAYLNYTGPGAKYDWGDGKGKVHSRPKKVRPPVNTPSNNRTVGSGGAGGYF